MRSLRFIVVFAAIAAISCAKTSLTNLWRSEDKPAALGNILVVSLERDESLREMWENAITSEFQANGVMARPAYTMFPTAIPDSQQVVVVAHRDKYDGVVVTHRAPASYTGKMDNDYAEHAPSGAGEYWRGWYHTHFMQASGAAPTGKDAEDARYQIDLANTAGGGTLLWTGSTTPVNPNDAKKVQKEVCGELVSELMRRGFVAKR
jgi:Lhr-like helicase